MTTIHHYSAETARTTVLHHGVRVGQLVRTLVDQHSLLWNFVRRELLGRFRGSLLGVFWVVIQPIFLFAVYFAIFGILFAPKDDLLARGADPAFAIYLFSGLLMFNSMTEGVQGAMASVTANGNLVKKVKFPCELLPVVPVVVSSVVFVVGCAVLVIAGVATSQVHFGLPFLAWPVLLVLQALFAIGFGLLLAAANVFVRDVGQIFPILRMAWFFATPIFWRFDMVEDKFSALGLGWVNDVLMLNPAMCFVLAQRQAFGIGHHLPPDEYAKWFPLSLAEQLGLAAAWTALFLVVGYGFFKSRRHKFADLV